MSEARSGADIWRVIEASAVIMVLAFFLYATRSLLNPVVLFALLWAVMLPFRGREGHAPLLTIAGVVTLVWVLSTTGTLLAPFILAMVLAYVLDPLVDALQRRGVRRTLAIGILTLPVLGVLAALVLFVLPAAIQELGNVIRETPVFFDRLAGWLEALRSRLLRVDLPLVDEEALLARLRAVDAQAVMAFLEERRAAVGAWIWTGVLGLGRGIGSVMTVLSYVALMPVLTFYLLRDWDQVTARLSELVPRNRRERVAAFVTECDHLVSRYLRGQIIVALSVGAVTALGLWATGFPYAGTLGLIVAVFSVVPYLGLILSLIPAVFIALVSGSVGASLLKVAVVYGVAQLLEGTVISPRIVGESVGLHPVWVVLALALGGFFFGFVGLLIAVPAAAVVKLLAARGLERYLTSSFYRGEAAA